MSLSSQYLEKLSQHYRMQMDEMETTFKITTDALEEATRVSDERDQKQHERIIELEKRLDELHETIKVFSVDLENVTFQVIYMTLLKMKIKIYLGGIPKVLLYLIITFKTYILLKYTFNNFRNNLPN